MSAKNKENSDKNRNPHRLGSRGYIHQLPKWDARLAELAKDGVTPVTSDWQLRAVQFLLARGAKFQDDGTLSVPNTDVANS